MDSVWELAQACGSFQKKHPRVTFDVYTANADVVRERVDRGLVDIGLLLEPVNTEKYDIIRLDTREEWCVLMSPDDPLAEKTAITPKDLKNRPVILPRRLPVQSQLYRFGAAVAGAGGCGADFQSSADGPDVRQGGA